MVNAPIAQWVARALLTAGKMKQAEMARRLTKELRREIDRSQVNKMVSGAREVAADEMLAIEAITGLPVPSPNVAARIPLLNWVTAGKLTEPRSQIPVEDVPLLAFADLGRGDFFALTVEGNSMDRQSPHGSIIVVNRADKELISGKCYVFWNGGETTYKQWQGGEPPYLEPFSTDPIHKPQFVRRKKDFGVVGRVRRTVLDL